MLLASKCVAKHTFIHPLGFQKVIVQSWQTLQLWLSFPIKEV